MMANDNKAVALSFSQSVYPWVIVFCGMLFYCYNYFLRVSPSVMQPELTQAFHITATQFGTLAAFYYYAYTPMQIPAGMIYDKFGVRFVLCLACLTAVIGLSVFISANNYSTAEIGRFMIGLGCAFAYIGTLKLASIWLPPNRFATVAGLASAIGMTSGALSQKYLAHFVETIGYQRALHSVLIAGIVLSVIIILLVRNHPKTKTHVANETRSPINMKQLGRALQIIFTNPQMWYIGLIGCLLYLPASVFLDLWGITYLKSVYHITSERAVGLASFMFYGWIIASPILGALSDKIKRRRMLLTVTGSIATLLFCLVFYAPGITVTSLYFIFFAIGFCCGAHSLCFALGKENNSTKISGTAVAITNMFIMAGGLIFQPVIGKLIDFHASKVLGQNGLPVYVAGDYTFALSVIPIGFAIGTILTLFVKETYCESQVKEEHERIFNPIRLEPKTESAMN